MSRTPLFDALRRQISLARLANRSGAPSVSEVLERRDEELWTRRRFLKTGALAGLVLGAGCAGKRRPVAAPPAAVRGGARVVIVGAGIAGLNAAYRLSQAGVRAEVYEAANRTGGRLLTAHDLLAPGLTTELGGEFIDSNHEEMHVLVRELGLDLLDSHGLERGLEREAYLLDGSMRTEAEVIEAFRPVAARMEEDAKVLEEVIDFEHEGGARSLDRTSLAEYLRQVGAEGWIGELLEVAYVTEYGLEAAEQSALNLLLMISTDTSAGLALLGESDERYRVRGGNQQVVDQLARRVDGQIRLGHRLVALAPTGEGYELTFEGPNAAPVAVPADVVLLALPFTLLREVEVRVELPEPKRRAIAELGYGTNAKLLVGVTRRVWQGHGYAGSVYSDEAFQLAWDSSLLQPGEAGGLTLYSGGRAGLAVGEGQAAEQVRRLIPGIDRAFPGTASALNGNASRMHWPTYRYTKGSYACYRPGQWTAIAGAEGMPVGRLFFAGEHCSRDFQGFMNGGAETGKQAAAAIAALLGKEPAKSAHARPARRPALSRRELALALAGS